MFDFYKTLTNFKNELNHSCVFCLFWICQMLIAKGSVGRSQSLKMKLKMQNEGNTFFCSKKISNLSENMVYPSLLSANAGR